MKNIFTSAWIRFVCILLGCGLLLSLLLPMTQPPFGAVFGVVALAALLCCIFIRKTWVIYVTMVCLPLFGVASFMEFHLHAMYAPSELPRETGSYKSTWNTDDPLLGFGPKPQKSSSDSQGWQGDKLLYDVIYTTNDKGWRITPEHPDARNAVVFLGCSFTVGQGVPDEASYPYEVGKLLGSDYQVFNFGFRGYGSHQALALLQSGMLDDIFRKYQKVYVFFLAIAHHDMRAAGLTSWDTQGPRYVLRDGKVTREGNFHNWPGREGLVGRSMDALNTSYIYRELIARPRARHLHHAILHEAQQYIRSHYPASDYTVLVYPDAQKHVPALQGVGITQVVDTTPFFPLPLKDPSYIIEGEGHPSAEAYRVLAEGIAKRILNQNTPAPEAKRP